MAETNEEKEIHGLIKGAYQTVTPPPDLKDRLLEEINFQGKGTVAMSRHTLWERPRIWLPIAIAAVAAVIAYGAWLSVNITQNLLP